MNIPPVQLRMDPLNDERSMISRISDPYVEPSKSYGYSPGHREILGYRVVI